jgi:DNA repair photolyase
LEGIVRKKLLYKSGLGFLCVNAAQGCAHGCRYPCYAFLMAAVTAACSGYEDWIRPKIVSNAPELLEKELGRLKERPESIHFSLTTDPFMTGTRNRSSVPALDRARQRRGIPVSH